MGAMRPLRYAAAAVTLVAVSFWYRFYSPRTAEDFSLWAVCAYFGIACVVCLVFRTLGLNKTLCLRKLLGLEAVYKEKMNVLNLVITALSLASCAMFVVETYMPALTWNEHWLNAEVIISVIFLVDYVIRLGAAMNALHFIVSIDGVISILTTVPVLVNCYYALSSPEDNHNVKTEKLTHLRVFRLVRLLRILRALKIIRAAPNEGLYREIFHLVFTVVCLIFSAAGIFQWLENDDSCFLVGNDDEEVYCVAFHEALYWCTIEVLGRPRMVIENTSTWFMLITLVALSVLLIPWQLAAVVEVFRKTNYFQRHWYTPSAEKRRHLVVVGHREFASMNMLLYEFFDSQRGEHPVQEVVFLFPSPPGRDIELLLMHPMYLGRVTYLQGTPLQDKDLERAALADAAAVIVLANKESDKPHWHDGELLTCIQYMKAYWLRNKARMQQKSGKPFQHRSGHLFASSNNVVPRKDRRPRIIAQVLLPETKEYLIELPGWTPHDVVVVCTEYVSWMLGMATLFRGMATVVFNLMSHMEVQRAYSTRWYPAYERGAKQGLYSIKIRPSSRLVGLGMTEGALQLAAKECIFIAVERGDYCMQEFDGLQLFPGPDGFSFESGDRLFCIAESNPVLEAVFESMENKQGGSSEELAAPEKKLRATPTGLARESQQVDISINPAEHSDCSTIPRGCEEVAHMLSNGGEMEDLPESLASSAPDPEGAPPPSGSGQARRRLSTLPPKEQRQEILDVLQAYNPPWQQHVIFCGLPKDGSGRPGERGLLTELIRTLSRISQERLAVCVVDENADANVADLCMKEPFMARLAIDGRLRTVSAHPRHCNSLLHRAHIMDAKAVVALPDRVGDSLSIMRGKGGDHEKMVMRIVDTNTVLTMQVARGCRLRSSNNSVTYGRLDAEQQLRHELHCVTLLNTESTSSLFFGNEQLTHDLAPTSNDPRWMDITPLNMSPSFAAGEILAMTCFDRFTVEALFTPQVVPLIRMMCFGSANGHRLRQVRCPDEFVGCAFADILATLIRGGRAPLGLVRFPESGSPSERSVREWGNTTELPDAVLPYVLTNPTHATMRASDFLFYIGSEQDGSRLSDRKST